MMTARFDIALRFVMRWEGGKVDAFLDRGGRTAYGVTQETYDAFRKAHGHPTQDVWEIGKQEVKDIYWERYWLPAKCGLVAEPIDLIIFDAAVQHGTAQAAKFLQRAVFVDADGVIGAQTLKAMQEDVASGGMRQLVIDILAERRSFYYDLIERHPEQEKFRKGWMNRLDALRVECLGLGQ